MENTEKLVYQLFIWKVSGIIGVKKTTELLKEARSAFAHVDSKNSKQK